MSRRGRPPGVDSEQTRASIIQAARQVFAQRGFAATTVASLAEATNLAPSAIYHYFGGKAELYEAVFEATADGVWSNLDQAVHAHESLRAAIESMLENATDEHRARPFFNVFLSLVPMEARLHPEFAHLLDRRTKYQDATFAGLATLGLETGELTGFTHAEATEILRSVVMGWFFEQHHRGREIDGSRAAVFALFDRLASKG